MMDAITAAYDGDIQMIDTTSIRAHQQAATAKRGIEITVSVDHAAGLPRKYMPSSMRKGFRSDVASSAPVLFDHIWPIGDQAAGGDVLAGAIDRGQPVPGR
jgi:hypothetical protein